MKVIDEFKGFIARGNLIDLAVGIMIGGAFNGLVKSFVDDILTPLVGIFTGRTSLDKWVLTFEVPGIAGEGAQNVSLNYGKFLQSGIDFLILAVVIFLFVKMAKTLREKAEDPTNKTVPTPKDIQLLAEIRDLLKETNKPGT